ncbi:hypothetical protein GGI20_000852 [Coemansia sp. BCRC 34301]|nr:hypothetical protein GGI20_000852 [Coemansia sp. BCRC 34301]
MSFSQQAGPTDGAGSAETRMVVVQEIGWLFAEEYYTVMNGEPERLHMFYGRKSTCIHGTEGQTVDQINGQQDINALIASEDFKGSKVHVVNVDTLPSIDGSIVVQVIGEMSNNSPTSRRFVQTFLLVEQPGGYYLHNDILRYLKEDVEGCEAIPAPNSAVDVGIEVPTVAVSLDTDSAVAVAVCPKKDEKVDADELIKQAEVPSATAAAAAVAEVLTPVAEIKAAVAEAVAATVPESKPKASREKPAASEAPKVEKPVAPVPTMPTSWANLAATNSGKWGSDAISKVGGTVAPATTASGAGANAGSDPSSRVSTPASGARDSRRKDTFSVFMKNIARGTSVSAIKFSCKTFGQVVNVDYVQSKTTAVVEFGTEAARQAALSTGTIMVAGSMVVIEERRNRQSSGRRDDAPAGAAKQSGAPAQGGSGAAPPRNSSGEFERVGSSRGSRSRPNNSNGGSNVGSQTSAAQNLVGQAASRSRPGK